MRTLIWTTIAAMTVAAMGDVARAQTAGTGGGGAAASAAGNGPTTQPTTRPHDPWVFRSVLDKRARMLTVALHPRLWVAYDAQTCTLYRAWPGGVKFTGAVYDTRHGPQPQAEGEPYEQLAGPAAGWRVVRGGEATPVQADYRGYELAGSDRVTLRYVVPVGDAAVEVAETPEALVGDDGVVALRRTFTVRGLPAGAALATYVGGAGVERAVSGAQVEGRDGEWTLTLTRDGTAELTSRYTNSSKEAK